MAVIINEVIVRAIITGNDAEKKDESSAADASESIAAVTKNELLELIDEVMTNKKER